MSTIFTILNKLQLRPLNPRIAIGYVVVSLLGFFDATYLTIEHFLGKIPPCTVVSGCETVLTSPYATPFGVPVALVGALFYLTMFVLMLLYLDLKKDIFLKLVLLLSVPAFIATLGFVYLMVFVIKALCLYCLGSAFTSTTLFIVSVYVVKKYRTIASL